MANFMNYTNFFSFNCLKKMAQLGFQVAVSDFYVRGGVAAKSW
jgi:hypothetical protein